MRLMRRLLPNLRGAVYYIDSIHLHHEDELDQVQLLPEGATRLTANVTTIELYVYTGAHAERLIMALASETIVTTEWLQATKEEIGE